MVQLNDFGVNVKKRLIDLGQNQNWLIERVKEKTGMFFDSAYLQKLMTGKATSAPMVKTIYDILGIGEVEA